MEITLVWWKGTEISWGLLKSREEIDNKIKDGYCVTEISVTEPISESFLRKILPDIGIPGQKPGYYF